MIKCSLPRILRAPRHAKGTRPRLPQTTATHFSAPVFPKSFGKFTGLDLHDGRCDERDLLGLPGRGGRHGLDVPGAARGDRRARPVLRALHGSRQSLLPYGQGGREGLENATNAGGTALAHRVPPRKRSGSGRRNGLQIEQRNCPEWLHLALPAWHEGSGGSVHAFRPPILPPKATDHELPNHDTFKRYGHTSPQRTAACARGNSPAALPENCLIPSSHTRRVGSLRL